MATTAPTTDILKYRDWNGRDHPVSGSELAKGMLLLRASNMNVMRLQLAMERRDRRLAMEALDGLVALDREISGFIEEMPPTDGKLGEMARRIDDQKAILASEKLIFAAGKTGPALAQRTEADMPTVIEPRSLKRPPDFAPPVDPELDWAAACALEADPPRRNRAPYIIAGLLVFALGTAAILYLFGVDTLPSFDAMSTMLGDYS